MINIFFFIIVPTHTFIFAFSQNTNYIEIHQPVSMKLLISLLDASQVIS
ncbi:unnamed protein product [Schistosoma margrebowiei]|uniref:Uncharacterized protein n=1 Tax=Schistosoma margrebowiei TaxID=48269 RepID=A0A3P8EYT0_9TREM|nr:unnamed protein product [Schistosoma margrebowiei]